MTTNLLQLSNGDISSVAIAVMVHACSGSSPGLFGGKQQMPVMSSAPRTAQLLRHGESGLIPRFKGQEETHSAMIRSVLSETVK